jgi:DNA repair exonuclease SbcCD ATPase subunit
MRLANLKICGIRGFNLEKEINLDDGLTVIYGPNGEGKTSFVEALEWLIFGIIFKKEKALSKREFKDTIKNIHFTGDTPYVEAILKAKDEVVKIRREYINENDSRLFINDELSENFYSETVPPIIYQHGLKSFIHTQPKERYLEFMRLLNIDEIDDFIVAVRGALNSYKKSKPIEVNKALLFCDDIQQELPEYHELLIEKNYNLLQFAGHINEEIQIIDEKVTKDNIESFKKKLIDYISKTKKEEFDLEIFSPILSYEPIDLKDVFDNSQIKEAFEFLTQPESVLAANRLDVLRNGLKIIEGSDIEDCPLCFEKTIDEAKVQAIKSKYSEFSEFKTKTGEYTEIIETHASAFTEFKDETLELLVSLELDEEIIKSCEGFGLEKELLQNMVETHGTFQEQKESIKGHFEFIGELLGKIKKLEDIDTKSKFKEYDCILKNLKEELIEINKTIESLSDITQKLKGELEKKISSSDKVRRLERISRLLDNIESFTIAKIDSAVEKELSESLAELKEYRDDLLKRMLSSHKVEIINWYDLLNPDEDTRISNIDNTKDKVNIIVSCYGVEKQAVPILSEAHLNCLGLSIFLSQITNSENPFKFILIDDPVQSMDELHTDNFINEVIEKLLEKGFQVFVFSHLHTSVASLILKRYKELFPTNIEFYGYSLEGPQIKIRKEDSFENYINGAEQNHNGDLEQRKMAANMIRQALEAYAKSYYCKKSGTELPISCKKSPFSELDNRLFSKVAIDGEQTPFGGIH